MVLTFVFVFLDFSLVQLSMNTLTGPIPSELALLPSLSELWLSFNAFTGTIPEEITTMNNLRWLICNNNKMTGTLPNDYGDSLFAVTFNHNKIMGSIPFSEFENDEYFALLLHETDLTGSVPNEFCSKVKNLKLDVSPWLIDKPKVECPCCKKTACYLWENFEVTVKGTRRPPCPENNIHSLEYFEVFWATDKIADITIKEFFGTGLSSETELCLSPTGCYNIHDLDKVSLDLNLSYSASSKSLAAQDVCDAVDLCGTLYDINDPKRMGLNHLTQLIAPDFDERDKISSEVLCWIMNEDPLFDEFEICDGTLLQRFVFALFFKGQPAFDFSDFSSLHTCAWPGLTCDPNGRFVEHMDLSSSNLQGTIMTEIGFLPRLKSIRMNGNDLVGSIKASIFTYMPNLEVLEFGNNRIGGEIEVAIFRLPQLKEFNFANNSLTGILPDIAEYPETLGKFLKHQLRLRFEC